MLNGIQSSSVGQVIVLLIFCLSSLIEGKGANCACTYIVGPDRLKTLCKIENNYLFISFNICFACFIIFMHSYLEACL